MPKEETPKSKGKNKLRKATDLSVRSLTEMQLIFADHYLLTMDEKAAAKKAGYRSAWTRGPQLLRHPAIARYITDKKVEVAKQIAKPFSPDEWIDKMRLMWDMIQGKPTPFKRFNPETGKMEQEVTEVGGVKYVVYKVEGSAGVKWLELVGRHLGAFIDKLEVNGITAEMTARLGPEEQAMLYQLYSKMRG